MQARAPDEGPSGVRPSASETSSQLTYEEVDIEERHDPMLLRAVVARHNINSTKSLVAAYNVTTDEDERAVLLGWLRKYHERREDSLAPKAVLEYAELVDITPRSEDEEAIIQNLIDDLRSCISGGEFLKPNFAAAIFRALVHVDVSVNGGVAEQVVITRKLLGSLSATPKLERGNFSVHRGIFLVLQQTLYLLRKSSQSRIDEEEKEELRFAIAEQERVFEQSCKYYPVKFHFQVLRQTVERLKTRDIWFIAEAFFVICEFCGFAHVLHSLPMLACIDICPEAVQRAYRKTRDSVENMGVLKRPWFDTLWNLTTARLKAAKDEIYLTAFESVYNTTLENQRRMRNSEELKALRFGIIDELGILAIEGSSESTRREATFRLSDLATQQAIGEEWIDDDDILTALLDAIYEVHKSGQCNEKTKDSLTALHRYCEDYAGDAMMAWLDGKSMEEKLRARSPLAAQLEHKDLFIKTRKDVGYTPLTGEDLRKIYLRDDFATVVFLLDEGSSRHVKDMKQHILIFEEILEKQDTRSRDRPEGVIHKIEDGKGESSNSRRDQAKEDCKEKTRVASQIALDDLFERISLKAGDPESEVRRVLLYGNPGSGKTCITKIVAHKWALGKIARDFDAVYILPVGVLNSKEHSRQKWIRLEEAISQIYFSESKHTFSNEDLIAQVERDLDNPSTLLMLDGLDEAGDHAMELLSTVWKRSCKVLFLSRSHNTRDVKTRVDIQVECLGFDDQQLRDYIKNELSEDEAPKLIHFLEDSDALWEMAHIPVTASVLCSLSKKHKTATEERGKRASMFQIYSDITHSVWKRFEERPKTGDIQKAELLKDIEKIAFESLRKGLILVHERFVIQHASTSNATRILEESGLLVPVSEGQEYQFAHQSFQKYFAARYIAKHLRTKGLDERRVVEFVQQEKYNRKHALTLTFAMQDLAQGRSKSALRDMLSRIDETPIEVVGIQHFFLKMRLFEATLEETDEDDLEELLNDRQVVKLVESARRLLERTIEDALIRKIVVQEFQQLPRILEEFPRVLNDTIEEVKKTLDCVNNSTREETARITDVLKPANHNLKPSDIIIRFLSEEAEEPTDCCSPKKCNKRMSSIAERLPQRAGEVLAALTELCSDEDWRVRQDAMAAIGSVVTAEPQYASEVLPTLSTGCGDGDRNVRRAAMTTIGRIVATAPQHAGKALPTLFWGCDDRNWHVRQASMTAIGSVVTAEPQQAREALQTLSAGCGDGDWHVRQEATMAIDRVSAAVPQHAGEALPTLAKKCGDECLPVSSAATFDISCVVVAAKQQACETLLKLANPYCEVFVDVRRSEMTTIDGFSEEVPQNAGEALPTLSKFCSDSNLHVRQASMTAIGRIVATAPQNAGEALPTLSKLCSDSNLHVRRAAITAIGCIVATAPQHAGESLPTLSKGCGDGDTGVRLAAIEAIRGVVEAAPQYASKILPTLSKVCGDRHLHVRRQAMVAIGSVAAAAPQHVGDALPTLSKGLNDRNWHVRLAAMTITGILAAADPQHAGKVLPALAKGFDDRDWHVRQAVITAIGRVVVAAPQHAGEALPTLVEGCGDGIFDVRNSAITAIGCSVTMSPQHAGEFLSTIVKGCNDGDCNVRQAAMTSIGSVATADSQHASDALQTLSTGCRDKAWNVREAAMIAIGRVIAAAPRHANKALPTILKGCGNEAWHVRRAAMTAISIFAAAEPQHVGKFLPTIFTGCGDREWHVRQAAMAAIGRVIAAAPQHAGKFLPTLSAGCRDKAWHVREAAMITIGRVIAAARQFSAEALPTLSTGFNDRDLHVRQSAITAIGSVVVAAPQHASEILPALANGFGDRDWPVRQAVITAIGHVVVAAPQHAGEALPTLVEGCGDVILDVRQAAMTAIGSVAVAAPQHVAEVLPTLLKGCGDGAFCVRQAAMTAIGSVAAAAPQHVAEVLPTLLKGCGDGAFCVRQAAMTAIGSVAAAAPRHVGEVLPTLLKGCGDRDWHVRQAAVTSIGSVVAESSHIFNKLLHLLKRGYEDEDFLVRQNAIEAVCKASIAKECFAHHLLPTLVCGCSDKDFFVRQNALELVSEVVLTAPHLAGELLMLLDGGFTDEVFFVRWSAIEAVGKVVVATPHLADKLLPMLKRAQSDENLFVRLSAIKAIGLAIETAPQLVSELTLLLERGFIDQHKDVRLNSLKAVSAATNLVSTLMPMLERGCTDEHNDVRLNTLKAIGGVVGTALHLVGERLPMLQIQCGSEHFSSQQTPETTPTESIYDWIPQSSISALKSNLLLIFVKNSFTLAFPTKEKKVPIVLHALSSHEIGSCEGEALDKHLEYLKKDYEEKFPGLLENLAMKE